MRARNHGVCASALLAALVACSSSSSSGTPPSDAGGDVAIDGALDAGADTFVDDDASSPAQLPPTGAAAVEAWLAEGHYKLWHCDMAMRPARSPSTDAMTRICSNNVASGQRNGAYAIGAASVQEVGDANGNVIALNVQRKMTAGLAADTWYWFGKLTAGAQPIADGLGSDATVATQCVGCHRSAGDEAGIGHDFVFTQIP